MRDLTLEECGLVNGGDYWAEIQQFCQQALQALGWSGTFSVGYNNGVCTANGQVIYTKDGNPQMGCTTLTVNASAKGTGG